MQRNHEAAIQNIFATYMPDWVTAQIQSSPNLSANEVFFVTAHSNDLTKKFVIKIYGEETRAAPSCEPLMYNLLSSQSQSLATAKKQIDGIHNGHAFLITEYIPGQELLQIIEDNKADSNLFTLLANQLINFINECIGIKNSGYGFIDTNNKDIAHGVLASWVDFLHININHIKKIFSENANKLDENDNLFLEGAFNHLSTFIINNDEHFKNLSPKLIPIDLNLRNFIVSETNELHMIDLESFLIGDELLAYGELFGHVYKTPFGECFAKLWDDWNSQQKQLIHFYALLSNMNVLAFKISKSETPIKLTESYLWGNSNNFHALIFEHGQYIADNRIMPALRR